MPKRRTEHPNDDKSSSHDTPILKRPRVEEKSTTGACASEAGDVHTRDSDVADEASVEALLLDTSTESVTMKRNAPVDVISKCGIIESIELKQFMCHKYLTFDFGPQMNFIIGHNGSGKSAVLLAIIIALGGKTASKGREKGLRSFIQDGKSVAEITIRIKNQGEGAFKPAEYGGSISITRRFTKQGCTTWRIVNDIGKTINTKREEVTAICEHMNIQVDNPLNILTQDSARDFLSYSSLKQVYKMFLEGTSLEKLNKDYEVCNESLNLTVETMERTSKALSGLERAYKLASGRYDEAIQARSQQDRVVELEKELAWAAVNEKERELSDVFEETASQEQQVARARGALDEAQKTFNSASDDVRRAEKTYDELACIQHLIEERRELHKKLCRAKGNFGDVKMIISYQETNSNLSMLQKLIRVEVARTLASQGKCNDHNRQSMEAHRRGNESLPGILDRIKQIDKENRRMEAKREARKAELEVAQEGASHARNMIEQIRELERNRYAAYGKDIQQLLGHISLTSWAGATPIGPLGAYVRCREPEKWGDILRSQLGGMLTAYAVTDHRDAPTLRRMLRQSGNEHLSIIVSEQADIFDYAHGEPSENMLTVLQALEISDPYVLRILISQSGIERTFLSTTHSEGEDILKQYGRQGQVWTADGFLIRRSVDGVESHSPLKQRRNDSTSTLLTGRDDDAQRRHYENELQEKEAQIQRLIELEAVFLEEKKELDEEKNKAREMEEFINQSKACRHQTQEAATATIASLEALKKESEDEKTAIEGQIVKNTALKTEICAEIAKLQRQLNDLLKQIDENDKQRREFRAAIDDAVHRLTEAQHALKYMNGKLFEDTVKLDDMQRKGRLLEEEGYALVVKALELSPQVETKRSQEAIHSILEITRAALQERGRQHGATVEETVVELNKTKSALEMLKNEYKQLRQLRATQMKSVTAHIRNWYDLHSHISRHTKHLFQYNLYRRGYFGQIAFSVDKQTLEIRVQKTQHQPKWQHGGSQSLGCGEKSIITLSLLLALWDVAGCSLMCLDGFDVFMDGENRTKSIKQLIANTADKQCILTTPHEIGNIALGDRVRVHRCKFHRHATEGDHHHLTFTTMFYIIGLGLCDENDITVRGLQAIKNSSRVYLEAYTSILMVSKDRLEAFYEKPLILADRDMVETNSDAILENADKEDVSLLVVGDPFGATTHTDIILRARALGIPTRVIHNASIMNAAGACGLQLYNFGQTVSLVFFTDTWKPDSFYDRIKENADLGLHTLVLLDIKVKEQSEENLARGRKIYEPPRYMTIPQAVNQLIEIEGVRQTGILSPDNTLAVALSRVGGGQDNERIVAGTLTELASQPVDIYGQPLHSLIIVGKRLHHLEVAYAESYALNREKWRQVAQDVYGCALD